MNVYPCGLVLTTAKDDARLMQPYRTPDSPSDLSSSQFRNRHTVHNGRSDIIVALHLIAGHRPNDDAQPQRGPGVQDP